MTTTLIRWDLMTSDDYPYWDYDDYYNQYCDPDDDEQYYMELLMELRSIYREYLDTRNPMIYYTNTDWESGV